MVLHFRSVFLMMTAGYTRGDLFSSPDSSWRPAHQQNAAVEAVFVFGDGQRVSRTVEHHDEVIELPVLKSRQREKRPGTIRAVETSERAHCEVACVDREVCHGDTLQGLALQYGCTVG